MDKKTFCCLCRTYCKDFRKLVDDNGQCNEVYQITVKYFHSKLLDPEEKEHNIEYVICMECWIHINDFHKYQKTVWQVQSQWEKAKSKLHVPATSKLTAPIKVKTGFCLKDLKHSFKCKICSETYTQIYGLRSHIRKKHSPIEPLTYFTCPYCKISVLKQSELKNHIKINHGEIKLKEITQINVECVENYTPGGYETYQKAFEESTVKVISTMVIGNAKETSEISNISCNIPSENQLEINTETINHTTSKHIEKLVTTIDVVNDDIMISDIIAEFMADLECPICEDVFPYYTLFTKHFRQKHPKENCHIICCDIKWYDTLEFVQHIDNFHRNPVSGISNSIYKELKKPLHETRTIKLLNRWHCKNCLKHFATRISLNSHKKYCNKSDVNKRGVEKGLHVAEAAISNPINIETDEKMYEVIVDDSDVKTKNESSCSKYLDYYLKYQKQISRKDKQMYELNVESEEIEPEKQSMSRYLTSNSQNTIKDFTDITYRYDDDDANQDEDRKFVKMEEEEPTAFCHLISNIQNNIEDFNDLISYDNDVSQGVEDKYTNLRDEEIYEIKQEIAEDFIQDTSLISNDNIQEPFSSANIPTKESQETTHIDPRDSSNISNNSYHQDSNINQQFLEIKQEKTDYLIPNSLAELPYSSSISNDDNRQESLSLDIIEIKEETFISPDITDNFIYHTDDINYNSENSKPESIMEEDN